MTRLEWLNNLSVEEARTELFRCCGSTRWAEQVSLGRPFVTEQALLQTAFASWRALTPSDWLEAFSHHPRIGDRETLSKRFSSDWASNEQSGMALVGEEFLQEFERLNAEYESKNGFIFLICATGKRTDEMLKSLRERLSQDRESELKTAAGEQEKIMEMRIRKLIH